MGIQFSFGEQASVSRHERPSGTPAQMSFASLICAGRRFPSGHGVTRLQSGRLDLRCEPDHTDCMIDVQELTKQFPLPGGRDLTAVDRVSFSVAAGEVYGLLGPNGAGKTTTLRMLLGLLRPTSGFAAIGGFRSVDFPDEVKRRVGLVAANAGLYQYLTPREMLLFFADLYGVSAADAREELARLVALLGLAEFIDQHCATLSTGQRQRVNLARALIHRPPVMLLDEPTLGLDVLG